MAARTTALLLAAAVAASCSSGGPAADPGREAYIIEFGRIDTARRGEITLEEARAYYARRFNEIDRNGDCFLTADEIAPELPFMNARRPADLLARLDRNGDQRLSREEFQVAANWLFQLARGNTLRLQEVSENDLVAPGAPRQRDFGNPRIKGK